MDVFDLKRELAQSKININLDEIDKEENINKFLSSREWDYTDGNKIIDLDDKVDSIYKKMDKEKMKKLTIEMEKINLDNYYKYYNLLKNQYSIGSLSSLNYMVDTTFYNEEIDEKKRINDLTELSPYMYKFRSILGDGDCFYRSLIFYILENIILTNNIMQMKELLILYYKKINKKNKLITKKDYLKILNQMNIDVVTAILFLIIENQIENNILKAYTILLKAFLFCSEFDFNIIFFGRYLIYEYISENENKIYSKEYQVEVGCLLPDNYVIDKGNKNDYLFEDFYALYLLKPKTFAEKIVLYVAPFVFNINMNILIYEYGINGDKSIVQEKKFLNENAGKNNFQPEINLLFRKMHYDIYYKLDYYEDYQKNFDILINKFEVEPLLEENHRPKFPEANQGYDKLVFNGKIDNDNIKEEEDSDNGNDNIQKKNDVKEYNNDKDNLKCPFCLAASKNEKDIFGLCDICLFGKLKALVYFEFLEFLKNLSNMVNSEEKFKYLLTQKKIKLAKQENISIQEAINFSKFNLNDILLSIKKNLCLACGLNNSKEDDFFIELPCKCRICSKICFFKYLKIIEKHIALNDDNSAYLKHINLLSCFCGFIYTSKNILYMIEESGKKGLYIERRIYQKYLYNLWNWRCCMCKNNFEIKKEFIKVVFDCQNINRNLLIGKMEFKHLICDECFYKYEAFIGKHIFCNICELEHVIIELIKVNECNEETNTIHF